MSQDDSAIVGRADPPALNTRYGPLQVPDDETDMIGRFLVRYGEWAWLEAVFVASVIPNGARLLDVGAFVGTFGLGVARLRPLGLLCCVEANGTAASLLRTNLSACAPCPSVVVEALVAGSDAVSGTGRVEPGNLGGMSFSVSDDPNAQGEIRATTLAGLRATYNAFDLIKLDIEGMELEALLGDADFLTQGKTALWIEANEDIRTLDVARLLLSWNLDLFYFAFPAFNRQNFNGDQQPIFPFAFEAGLLAGPGLPPSLSPELADAGCILRPVRCVEDLKDALWRTPRWGMDEWQGAASINEFAALVTRSLTEESFADFLSEAAVREAPTTIWQKLEAAQSALERTETLARDRLAQLEAEHLQRQQLLAQIEAERMARQQTEEALRTTTTLAAERLDQLHIATRDLTTIQSSTVWRVTAPMRRFLSRHPGLRTVLRKVRTLIRGAAPRTGPDAPKRSRHIESTDPGHRLAVLPYFDAAFYCAANADVLAAATDPLDHFLQQGWREGRSPGPEFDVAYYLAANPDVAAAGINPVLHYVWAGQAEGRLPRRRPDAWQAQLLAARPPSVRAADWKDAADRTAPLPRSALAAALGEPQAIVVSISHDDYDTNFGGIQNVIGDEQIAFAAAGWDYLHLSPAAPLPLLAEPQTDYRLRLRLNGKFLGVVNFVDLAAILRTVRAVGARLSFVFHHLLGHVPELLATLPEPRDAQTVVWIHDFFTLCPGFNLLRNDVKFCGGPSLASAACSVCVYGNDRVDQTPRIHRFFAAIHPLVVAPSRVAMDFWQARGDLPHVGMSVVPPARLTMQLDADPVNRANGARLRIAHLGGASLHKGWPVFAQLVEAHAGDPRYEFYHLGMGDTRLSRCVHDPVRVGPGQRDAMIQAVARHRIDVVICWSLWPETFCFTAHEALAGGAFVVARQDAGAIWPAVETNAPRQGCALADEAALSRLFETGEIEQLVARSHRVRGDLHPGGNTSDLLAEDPIVRKSFHPAGAFHP
jgi:FkbM family methyltransferase